MRLMSAALEQARGEAVTVSASLSSVTAYESYGFSLAGDVGEFAGLVYQPMEKRLPETKSANRPCVTQTQLTP